MTGARDRLAGLLWASRHSSEPKVKIADRMISVLAKDGFGIYRRLDVAALVEYVEASFDQERSIVDFETHWAHIDRLRAATEAITPEVLARVKKGVVMDDKMVRKKVRSALSATVSEPGVTVGMLDRAAAAVMAEFEGWSLLDPETRAAIEFVVRLADGANGETKASRDVRAWLARCGGERQDGNDG